MFGKYSAIELVKKFSSPLYVYDEKVLRKSCQKIKQLCNLKNFQIHYAVKANSNIALLKIIRSEGLQAEVISIPELKLAQMAGWKKEEILFSGNNITEEDLNWLVQNQFFICLDSLCQLETYFALGGDNACIRINAIKGEGHHRRVVTAGRVKFGIDLSQVGKAFELAIEKNKKIVGINSHIGSLFLEHILFQEAALLLLKIAERYPSVEYTYKKMKKIFLAFKKIYRLLDRIGSLDKSLRVPQIYSIEKKVLFLWFFFISVQFSTSVNFFEYFSIGKSFSSSL